MSNWVGKKIQSILYLARGGTILWDQFDRALWETMMQNNPILG